MIYVKYAHGKWIKAIQLTLSGDGMLLYDYKKCIVEGLRSNGNYEQGTFDPISKEKHWKGSMNFNDLR